MENLVFYVALLIITTVFTYKATKSGMIDDAINFIKSRKSSKIIPNDDLNSWEYGICNGREARRHKIKRNVQFKLWKKGDQKYVDGIGHLEDKWQNFDETWWDNFTPTN